MGIPVVCLFLLFGGLMEEDKEWVGHAWMDWNGSVHCLFILLHSLLCKLSFSASSLFKFWCFEFHNDLLRALIYITMFLPNIYIISLFISLYISLFMRQAAKSQQVTRRTTSNSELTTVNETNNKRKQTKKSTAEEKINC